MDVRVDRASTGTMWTYGLGSIAVGIKNNLLGTYLLIYYNQVLEVNALLVTAALFIALMIDAFTDPMVGIWSDRVRSKWGRRHPFMYAAIIPFAFSYYFILQDPGNLSQTEHFVRLVFLMFILRLSMTFYEIPRGALAPELTKDYDQRTQISGIGMALGWIGGAGIDYIYRAYYKEKVF
jgi:Na+/melibiose symporter and related transporters